MKKKTRVNLVIMPSFPMIVPPLSVACIYTTLKEYDLTVKVTDFRLIKNDVFTFMYLGYKDSFVIDVPDLPLILALVKNYLEHRPLLL